VSLESLPPVTSRWALSHNTERAESSIELQTGNFKQMGPVKTFI
jgi:hypothetical protein